MFYTFEIGFALGKLGRYVYGVFRDRFFRGLIVRINRRRMFEICLKVIKRGSRKFDLYPWRKFKVKIFDRNLCIFKL